MTPAGTRRKRPSMRDVANHAGVSVATVSYVLNGRDRVAEPTKLRVIEAVDALGFVPNLAARTMRAGTRGLGISVGDLRSTFDVDVVRGAQSSAREHGKTLLIGNGDGRGHTEYIDLFDQARLEGMIICDIEFGNELQVLHDRHLPCVLVNFREGSGGHCLVLMDNEDVGYRAAVHLIELGRTKLLWITDGRSQPLLERRRGIDRAIAEFSNASVEEIVVAGIDDCHGRSAGAVIAQRSADLPDGVIAGTGLIARGFVEELHTSSALRVPQHLRLISTDGNELADTGSVKLSRFIEPGVEMGRRALELLLREVEERGSGHRHREIVLKAELHVAESSLGSS